MKTYLLKREQLVPRPLVEVFAFFSDARNLDVITPDWLRFDILTPMPIAMRPGLLLDYRLKYRSIPLKWTTRIEEWEPNVRFVDTQLRGPYALWHHTHEFESRAGSTLIRDVVRYGLPLGPLGRLAHAVSVRRDVNVIFDYRVRKIAELFGEKPESLLDNSTP